MRDLKQAYRILFGSRRDMDVILGELEQLESGYAKNIAAFIKASKRNFHRTE